jgi:hypothetical protein
VTLRNDAAGAWGRVNFGPKLGAIIPVMLWDQEKLHEMRSVVPV